jgi:hypothetical protein
VPRGHNAAVVAQATLRYHYDDLTIKLEIHDGGEQRPL